MPFNHSIPHGGEGNSEILATRIRCGRHVVCRDVFSDRNSDVGILMVETKDVFKMTLLSDLLTLRD